MTNVQLTRHLMDMGSGIAPKIMHNLSRKLMRDTLPKARHNTRFSTLVSPWKSMSQSVISQNANIRNLELNKDAAMNAFLSLCKKHGFENISYHSKDEIYFSQTELSLPAKAYPLIILWYTSSHNDMFFQKFSSSYGENTIHNFEAGFEALFSLLRNFENPSWARSAGAEKRNLAMFCIGMLCNGLGFIGSPPSIKPDLDEKNLGQFVPYMDEISDYCAKSAIQIMNFYSWEKTIFPAV